MLPDLRAPVYGRAFIILNDAVIVHVSLVVHDLLRIVPPFRRVPVCAWKIEELWVGWQGTVYVRDAMTTSTAHD